MPFKTYSSGLTIKQPTSGTKDYFGTMDTDTYAKISAHDHTGGGKGVPIGTGAIVADAVTDAKIRLTNAGWLRARNAADSADLNLVRADSSNILRFANVGAGTRSDLGLATTVTGFVSNITLGGGATETSFTPIDGGYSQFGKTTFWYCQFDVVIGTTPATYIDVDLPVTAAAATSGFATAMAIAGSIERRCVARMATTGTIRIVTVLSDDAAVSSWATGAPGYRLYVGGVFVAA